MIPPPDVARMIAERGATPATMSRAVIEAVSLRRALDHIDDNLIAVEANALTYDDDGHQLIAVVVADIRNRIAHEIRNVDRALSEVPT